MKKTTKYLLIIFLLTIGTSLSAQTISTDKQWTMRYKLVVNPDEYGDFYTYEEEILRDDAVFDGMKFLRLYTKSYGDGEKVPDEWKPSGVYYCQQGDKIYLKLGNLKPRVVIDYSLQVGDSIEGYYGYYAEEGDSIRRHVPFIVTAVSDTVFSTSIQCVLHGLLHSSVCKA